MKSRKCWNGFSFTRPMHQYLVIFEIAKYCHSYFLHTWVFVMKKLQVTKLVGKKEYYFILLSFFHIFGLPAKLKSVWIPSWTLKRLLSLSSEFGECFVDWKKTHFTLKILGVNTQIRKPTTWICCYIFGLLITLPSAITSAAMSFFK